MDAVFLSHGCSEKTDSFFALLYKEKKNPILVKRSNGDVFRPRTYLLRSQGLVFILPWLHSVCSWRYPLPLWGTGGGAGIIIRIKKNPTGE